MANRMGLTSIQELAYALRSIANALIVAAELGPPEVREASIRLAHSAKNLADSHDPPKVKVQVQ